MNPADTNSGGATQRYQDFIPHTSKGMNQTIARIMKGGLNEVQVATYKRVFGKECFKAPCQCPRCKK